MLQCILYDLEITISTKTFAQYIELELSQADGLFSDNNFDMAASEERTIELPKNSLSAQLTLPQLKQQLTIRSLYDTF